MKISNYISIACFAFFGGMARYSLNAQWSFYGTFWGNIIGCFLLAFFTYFFMEFKDFRQWLTVGIGTGFVGAFTTFSTFNLDILKNIQAGLPLTALIYFLSSIIFGFIFAFLGMRIGKTWECCLERKIKVEILLAGLGASIGAMIRYAITNYGKTLGMDR